MLFNESKIQSNWMVKGRSIINFVQNYYEYTNTIFILLQIQHENHIN